MGTFVGLTGKRGGFSAPCWRRCLTTDHPRGSVFNLLFVTASLQPLTIFQRSLTTMQIQIQGLLQFAVPLFPTAEVSNHRQQLTARDGY